MQHVPAIPKMVQDIDLSDLLPQGGDVAESPLDLSDLLAEVRDDPTRGEMVLGHAGDRLLEQLTPGLKRLSHTHLAIMDYMLANPGLPLAEVARHFGYTQSWLSTMIHTDVFQAGFRERREKWIAVHDGRLAAKLHEVAEASLDTLLGILQDENNRPSPAAANEITKTALSALGFTSQKVAPATAVQVNVGMFSQQDLEDANRILQHGRG